MKSWYDRIVASEDLGLVDKACDFFQAEYHDAASEVDLNQLRGNGMRVEELEKRLPGIVGFRYHQLQEIEAILGVCDIRQTAIKGIRRRHYVEHYNRALGPAMVEKYVDSDDDVLAMALVISRVAHVRNMFVALSRQHEYLHYQLTNLSKLLVAGVNDTVL